MSAAAKAYLTALSAQLDQEIGISPWVTVSQSMIDAFARTTLDEQWIHLDADRARSETPFGGTIAHGFLTLSLASRFSYDALPDPKGQIMGVNYGFDKVRFLTPVRSGSRLRGRFALKAASARKPTQILRHLTLTIEIESVESPALVAEWQSLHIFD